MIVKRRHQLGDATPPEPTGPMASFWALADLVLVGYLVFVGIDTIKKVIR